MGKFQKGHKINLGKKHTKEWREMMSKRMMGNKLSLGRIHSKEFKEKISSKLKGRVKSEQEKKNISESRKGKKLSEVHRKALSNVQKRIGTIPPSQKGRIPWNFRNITPIHERIRRSADYLKWREDIFVRDNFTCQICGTRGGKLRANHIKRFALYPDLRIEPINGIVICEACDLRWVFSHEEKWESYFNFNLMTRGIITESTL